MKRFLILAALLLIAWSPAAFGQGARFDQPFMKPTPAGPLVAVSGQGSVCSGTGLTTTAATITNNVATLTMAANPLSAGFVNGRDVLIINFTGQDAGIFNGSFTLTAVTSTSLSFSLAHSNYTATSNGGAVMKPTASAGCAPQVNVYSDSGLTSLLTQPFQDDGKGNLQFWGAAGVYYVAYSASGLNPIPLFQTSLAVTPNASGSVNIQLNPLVQTTPSAGKYLRDNGTSFQPSSVAAAGAVTCSAHQFANALNDNSASVCAQPAFSDISGTASTSQIGTGSPAASKYVDGGTGAWTALPTGGVSEVPVSFNAFGGGTGGVGEESFNKTIFPAAHTLIRFTIANVATASGCSTLPVIAFWDATAGSAVTSITLANGTSFYDSGALSIALTAGHQFDIKITTAASGCTTSPTLGNMFAIIQ